MERTKVFISYSHKDDKWRERLVSHLGVLSREGLIDLWDDLKIRAGEDFLTRIHTNMLEAKIAVLLISADFLTSEFIRTEEVPRLFDAHVSGGMTIYPLLVRDCAWQEVPWLSSMQLRPRDAKAVANRRDKADRILADVAREIADVARSVSSFPPISQPPASSATGPVVDKWVNPEYVERAGIAESRRAEGYDLCWVDANHESERIDLNGWQYVVTAQSNGTRARFKFRDSPINGGYQVLLEKPRTGTS